MSLRQAAQQALEALTLSIPKPRPADDDYAELGWKEHNAAITALRAALAEPEQEPVAWLYRDSWGTMKLSQIMPPPVGAFAVYTAPTPRKPLSDEEMRECAQAMNAEPLAEGWPELIKFARAIERAHGIGEGQ